MELIFDPKTQQVSIDKSKFSIKMKTAFAEGYFLRKRRRDLRRAAAKIGGVFHFLVKDEPHPEEADESVEPVAVETEKAAEARKTHEKLAEMDERIGRDARYALMKDLPIVPNRVVFSTFQNTFTCNPRYIAEELLRRHADCQIIFVVNRAVYQDKDAYEIPPNVWLVSRGSIASFVALGTAKIWVDNALNCIWKDIPKKDGQIYINTWHGSLGIKRLGGDEHWLGIAQRSQDYIDYFLINSTFDKWVFRNSFWSDETKVHFLRYGHPRNDIFYNEGELARLRTKVYTNPNFNIPLDVHTALYAPTFRDNKGDVSAIRIDCGKLKEALEEKFGGNWKILVKAHMHNRHNPQLREMFAQMDHVIDASDYNDMQELLAAVDVGITDYSSWIFDFIATRRPGFIYARDIEQYINSRGFYYPLSETPFSIASSDEQLCANIMKFDEEDYAKRLQAFFVGKGYFEDGTASEQTADFILAEIEKEKQKQAHQTH
ncbi:MAG: CDP-glycerol glycerophosphotransferase family protein [Clostridia bacterium]|nr:CDP-glycerol glycerophosphotransferase family protein [Clostridia bacterium]